MKRFVFVLFAALLSGCGTTGSPEGGGAAAAPLKVPFASAKPPINPSPPAEGLKAIQAQVQEIWPEIERRHSVAWQTLGTGDDKLMLQIRSYGDVERELTQADVDAIRDSLFEEIGEEFPIDISVLSCCSGAPFVTGEIRSVDEMSNRILVVNESKKNGNTDDPEAYWIELSEDGKIVFGDGEPTRQFDTSLVGKEAKVWTTGLVHQSYPGQTAALKVIVE
ncbi:DUF3221 domain-containing protein [Cohnella terricola]|uniref:Uncharacterized protein n=1 Tax=Cohnella terricola TaxID=1289167 RepID=A0A559JTS6_9BACL|nr:DUF3221 domain-containing protein [Cohnella terricola]TVY03282.1 hypothetical protein FPZ45_05245 [Cohnella terricola]